MSEDKCNLEACFYIERQRGTETERGRERKADKRADTLWVQRTADNVAAARWQSKDNGTKRGGGG